MGRAVPKEEGLSCMKRQAEQAVGEEARKQQPSVASASVSASGSCLELLP